MVIYADIIGVLRVIKTFAFSVT